jgi:hypothetical protein
MTTPATRGQIALALATVYVVWGSTYLAIRIGVETLPRLLMAGGRFVVAGAAIIAAVVSIISQPGKAAAPQEVSEPV